MQCDRLNSVCVGTKREGNGLGEPCDPENEVTACEGQCVTVNGLNQCSHRCAFGASSDCQGTSGDAGSSQAGLCVFPEATGSIGDVGFCGQLCNCNDECTHPDAVCDPFIDEEIMRLVDAAGTCVSALVEGSAGDGGMSREGILCP